MRLVPAKGSCPERSRKSVTPMAHTSARASTDLALRACSGAMYTGDPRSTWDAVEGPLALSASSGAFEMPKSSTFTTSDPSGAAGAGTGCSA